jgi:lysozyme family protein
MSTFEHAIPTILDHEGRRFTAHAWDPGGATKFGITLRYARAAGAIDADGDGRPDLDLDLDDDGDIDERDIMLLDEPRAREVYRRWWDRQRYDRIVDEHVATKVFDLSINMGPRAVTKSGRVIGAHALVQRAVNACGYRLLEDGHLGPMTIAAVNDCEPRELLLELCHQQTEHYRRWCDGFTKVPGDREVARLGLHKRGAWPFSEKDAYAA